MLEHYLNQTAQKVSTTRDKFGDYLQTSLTEVSCRFRYIRNLRRETNREISDSDALMWFAPTHEVSIGDHYLYEGVYYQVDRVLKARKLDNATVHFIKCEVTVYPLGVS